MRVCFVRFYDPYVCGWFLWEERNHRHFDGLDSHLYRLRSSPASIAGISYSDYLFDTHGSVRGLFVCGFLLYLGCVP